MLPESTPRQNKRQVGYQKERFFFTPRSIPLLTTTLKCGGAGGGLQDTILEERAFFIHTPDYHGNGFAELLQETNRNI